LLSVSAARDIDATIARLLRDLGDPEPPLRLELVRELLSLDRQYYSVSDPSVLQETVHRLKVGAKQVAMRPQLLIEVVKNRDLKALWVPDRRRILIDSDMPAVKHRWYEAHEIGHSVIEWHEGIAHGDQERTLSYECEIELEAEANYAAGRLLFLGEQFKDRVRGSELSYDLVKSLSVEFGNTMTSTLWRTVEAVSTPAFGLIGQHPRKLEMGKPLVRYYVRSREFEAVFGTVPVPTIYDQLCAFCWGNKGPIGAGEVIIEDRYGQGHVFKVDCFFNHHDTLSIGVYRGLREVSVAVAANAKSDDHRKR